MDAINALSGPPHSNRQLLDFHLDQTGDDDIPRDAILNVIKDLFSRGLMVITLEGRPDIGKTSLLRQFCNANASSTLSLFLKPHSWFLQDTSLLHSELAAQMMALLPNAPELDINSVDEGTIRRLFLQLTRHTKGRGQLIYFIIDGLEDVGDQAAPLLSALPAILPFEFSSFRFIFSDDSQWVPAHTLSTLKVKSFVVPGFTLHETTKYFSRFDLRQQDIDELYRSLGNGTPGYLASARRLLEAGVPPDVLLAQLHNRLPHPFDLEWQALTEIDDTLLAMLAVLAHDSNPHSLEELSSICDIDPDSARKLLNRCTFLDPPLSAADEPIRFVSASFRSYIAHRLAEQKNATWNRLASYFLKKRDSKRSVELLPTYLEQADRPAELLSFLDAPTFVNLSETSDSYVPILDRSKLGLETAIKLKRYGEAVRFGTQSSIVCDVEPVDFARAEILARLSLGQYGIALDLAQTTALKRHRLQLLASIGRFQKENGLAIESTIMEAIESLFAQLHKGELGTDLMETASDLLYSRPDLAIRLVTETASFRSDERNLDWALIRLSTIAATNHDASGKRMSETAATLRAQIRDPQARNFSYAMAMLLEGSTTAEVLKQVESLPNPGEGLFLLRQWARNTRTPKDAAPIIDYAVYLAIRTTEYTATASDYRDLADPLPAIDNIDELNGLINAFDIQKETARSTGPTQDYVQLQLLIGEAENKINPTRAGERLCETYSAISSVSDIEVRATCLAKIVAALSRLDPQCAFADTKIVQELSEVDFLEQVDQLLVSTADHYAATRGIIEALATSRPDLAEAVISRLNYEYRRDNARSDLARHILANKPAAIDLSALRRLLGAFADSEVEDSVVASFLP